MLPFNRQTALFQVPFERLSGALKSLLWLPEMAGSDREHVRRAVGREACAAPLARGGVDLAPLRQRKHQREGRNRCKAPPPPCLWFYPASASRPLQGPQETVLFYRTEKRADKNQKRSWVRRKTGGDGAQKKKVLRGRRRK